METPLNLIMTLPETNEEAKRFESMLLNDIDCGDTNPLKVLKVLKLASTIFDNIIKNEHFLNAIDREIEKYPLGKAECFGAKFSFVGRKTYDFSTCNDSKYTMLMNQSNELKGLIKAREEFLKNIQEPIADIESGEIINLPSFVSSKYPKVEINKK